MSNSWTELDLKALRDNIESVKSILKDRAEIIMVSKADAYGHGALEVARCAADAGVKWFAVAHLWEGVQLRTAIPDSSIVVVGVVHASDASVAIEHRLIPVLVSPEHADELAEAARHTGQTLKCHAKIDTGMGRLGLQWESAPQHLKAVIDKGGLELTGACMHFASAAGTPDNFADTQYKRFKDVVAGCARLGIEFPFQHVANSAAFLTRPEWDLDAVRLGIILYGYATGRPESRVRTRPVLQWKTTVGHVKEVPAGFRVGYYSTYTTRKATQIATINVGYADGYPRLLSNRGEVLIGGRRVPVVGRVSMNFIIADIGPDAEVKMGDEVVLIGAQGGESIWADEIARSCVTIPYEILTSIRTSDRRILPERV